MIVPGIRGLRTLLTRMIAFASLWDILVHRRKIDRTARLDRFGLCISMDIVDCLLGHRGVASMALRWCL